jgi:hypothetical protein
VGLGVCEEVGRTHTTLRCSLLLQQLELGPVPESWLLASDAWREEATLVALRETCLALHSIRHRKSVLLF